MFSKCPVCQGAVSDPVKKKGKHIHYACLRCGEFVIAARAEKELLRSAYDKPARKWMSHVIRRKYEGAKRPIELDASSISGLAAGMAYPNPSTQADYLVLWVGENQRSPGNFYAADPDAAAAVMGAKNEEDVGFIYKTLRQRGILQRHDGIMLNMHELQLTFEGWEKYNQLKAGFSHSNRVFMAMKFNQPDLDKLFNDFYKPILNELGYDLFRLDDAPKAGSITNRMRVAIKESRFVIADLSYGNRGAYWEAGFGEGLGKQVIYSVNESTLDKDHHFDVQGQQAVIWTTDRMEKAAKDLEACVKATFF